MRTALARDGFCIGREAVAEAELGTLREEVERLAVEDGSVCVCRLLERSELVC